MINKLIFAAAVAVIAATSAAGAQELTVAGPAVLDKEGTLEISGSGFEPEAPVFLLFTTADGVAAEIGYALDPEPVADAEGNWSTVWSYGRFVKKNLVAAGAFELTVTDDRFGELAGTSVSFTE